MGVLTNVFRRGGVFYFRARVPAPLRVQVGRSELWRSLRTCDPGEARRRGGMLLSLTEALWRDVQRAMSADEVQLLVDGWVRAKLEEDAEARRTTADREELERHNSRQMAAFGGALLRKIENDPQDAKPYVDELVSTLGLTLSERDYEIAVRLMIKAQYELLRALISRHTKKWRPWVDDDPAAPLIGKLAANGVTAPPVAGIAPQANFGLLSEVAREAIADFARKDGWRRKRIEDYETAVAMLTFALGRDADLGEVTSEVAGRYMRDLTHYPSNATKRLPYRELPTFHERIDAAKAANEPRVLDAVTINGKYLTPLRRIYEWRGKVKRELINPFKGLSAEKPKRANPERKRRDFTVEEIKRWFAHPMYVGSKGREGPPLYEHGDVKIDDWRVWVPLICLFSGMRLNEACGLAVADVRNSDGVDFFHVRDEVEGQSLKSIAARRKVPIHDALIGVGFLQFVQRQREDGRVRLFEDLEEDEDGYFSGRATKFFARIIDRIEDEEPDDPGKLVFHSTRHTVTTRLRVADVRVDVAKEIVGHEQGEVHGGYGGFPLPMLKEAVNKITYPGVDLGAVRRP